MQSTGIDLLEGGGAKSVVPSRITLVAIMGKNTFFPRRFPRNFSPLQDVIRKFFPEGLGFFQCILSMFESHGRNARQICEVGRNAKISFCSHLLYFSGFSPEPESRGESPWRRPSHMEFHFECSPAEAAQSARKTQLGTYDTARWGFGEYS